MLNIILHTGTDPGLLDSRIQLARKGVPRSDKSLSKSVGEIFCIACAIFNSKIMTT